MKIIKLIMALAIAASAIIPTSIMAHAQSKITLTVGNNSMTATLVDNVRKFLGTGSITLTLSSDPAGVDETSADTHKAEKVYDLNGNLITARPLPAGIYIINGKKTRITH